MANGSKPCRWTGATGFCMEHQSWLCPVAKIAKAVAKTKKLIYIAGSMRERDRILSVSEALRGAGYEVFNDWIMPGEQTDEKWQQFEEAQGRTYFEAILGPHATDVFEFDKSYLDRADAMVLVYPAGKSAHTELGYMRGRGRPALIYMDAEPERWDVMLRFANAICRTKASLLGWLDEVLK